VATRIRLQRIGAKKRAYYRIVVADGRTARGGKVIEFIGTYDPRIDPPAVKLDLEKVDTWVGKGAQPTEKMKSIIKRARKLSE